MKLYIEEIIKNNKTFIDKLIELTKIKEIQNNTSNYNKGNKNFLILSIIEKFNNDYKTKDKNNIFLKYAYDDLIIKTGVQEGISHLLLKLVMDMKEESFKYKFIVQEVGVVKKIPNSPLTIRATFTLSYNNITINTIDSNYWNEIRFNSDDSLYYSAGDPNENEIHRNNKDLIDSIKHIREIKTLFNYDREKTLEMLFNNNKYPEEEIDLMIIKEDLNIKNINFKKFGIDINKIRNGKINQNKTNKI